MKLVTFTHAGRTRLGAVESDAVVDFAAHGGELPDDMLTFLAQGETAFDAARQACAAGTGRLGLEDVRLEAPILRPPKILAVGLNYRDHAAEGGFDIPTVPMIFNKQSTAVTGPGSVIHLPGESVQLDYEAEFAFVIGARCRRVPKEKAPRRHRRLPRSPTTSACGIGSSVHRPPPWASPGTPTAPLGPYLVTPDEVGDPHNLAIKTWVNGELRQNSNTNDLIFDCAEIIVHLSTAFTLEPGDVICTGTPSGVGLGMDPKVWLKTGDVVRIEIDRLGTLENRVIDEPDDTVRY